VELQQYWEFNNWWY